MDDLSGDTNDDEDVVVVGVGVGVEVEDSPERDNIMAFKKDLLRLIKVIWS